MDIGFEWDPEKAASNRAKHRVCFDEAATIFADPLARIFDDMDHSTAGEHREIIVGHSERRRLLLVCFAERSGIIRIFSARRATRRERKDYEEGVKP